MITAMFTCTLLVATRKSRGLSSWLPKPLSTSTWSNIDLLSVGPLQPNFSKTWPELQTFHSRPYIWKYRLQNKSCCAGLTAGLYHQQYHFDQNSDISMSSYFTGFSKSHLWRHCNELFKNLHCNNVIVGAIASQITSLTIVYSIVYSDADQRKHQSCTSLAFVRGFHRGPVKSPHKWPVTWKMFPFDDVIIPIWLAILATQLLMGGIWIMACKTATHLYTTAIHKFKSLDNCSFKNRVIKYCHSTIVSYSGGKYGTIGPILK